VPARTSTVPGRSPSPSVIPDRSAAAVGRAVRSVCGGTLACGGWLAGAVAAVVVMAAPPAAALAQPGSAAQPGPAAPAVPADAPPAVVPPPFILSPGLSELKGRRVEDVAIRGNTQVSSAVIRNLIRTRPGEPFDPATVSEDYQRVFELRKFANVEARVEPTPGGGVTVTFVVTEQRQIKNVRFKGAVKVDEVTLREAIDIREGDAIDPFRIALARSALESSYKDKNYALAAVTVDEEALGRAGVLIFNIVEGPRVRVRNIRFVGGTSFSEGTLKDQIKTSTYVFIFREGKYSPEQVEEDVAGLRRYYESKGFFDARVGRKLVWSPDLTELQVDFLIDEGPRYKVDKVTFVRVNGEAVTPGSTLGVAEGDLRSKLKMVEGSNWDGEVLVRDVREVVRAYSAKYGFIYVPGSTDPDYLRVDTKPVFRREPGKVELVYQVREGKEFYLGNIQTKGNVKSQDKLILREFRDFTPGDKFNSAAMQDATERLRRLPYFGSVAVTPTGTDPAVRDLLVEVTETRTASFNIGAGVNSNGGVAGNFVYEERNFDIANWPASLSDLGTDRAFKGAGQNFRLAFEPGTVQTSASLRFSEPYVFDQPYSFTNEVYLRTRIREGYDDRRIGDTVTVGHRFTYNLGASVSLRGEDVDINSIEDRKLRAQEILDAEGHQTLTSAAVNVRYDTTNPGLFPTQGTITSGRWESYGALGGDFTFQKFTLGFEAYKTVAEDVLDRKTVLSFRGNAGYIVGDSPFFERFYGGGIGSIRGFRFRGVSPRSGRDEDPVGGDFLLTGTLEVGFPLAGEALRGVVFVDAGTVESQVRIGTVRTSAGVGVRVQLPFLGQVPLAIDYGYPILRDDMDDTQSISFSFGFTQ
jgi:outer membrane protein insertion porin family